MMGAPVTRVGVSPGAIATDDNNNLLTIEVPREATAGRLLVAVIQYPQGLTLTVADWEANGWTINGHQGTAYGIFVVASRVCTDNEPASYSFAWTNSAVAGCPPTMGALFVLVNATGEDYGITTNADAAFVNPFETTSITAQTSYADCSFMMCAITNDDGFADSADFDAHVEGICDSLSGSMVIQFDRRESASAVPAYSMQPVTVGDDAHWLQICFVGELPAEVSKLTPLDPPGSIGLPWVGA